MGSVRLQVCFCLSPCRHTPPEFWSIADRNLPSFWDSFHSPWFRTPTLGTSYTYVEFTETGQDTAKKDDKGGVKEAKKSSENVVEDRDSFKVSFDVSKFKPEEITIRSEDGELVVEGKQEAKSDEGYSTRHFVRAYSLPRNIDRDTFKSRLSKDGILSIEAKKLQQTEEKDNYIKIETEENS